IRDGIAIPMIAGGRLAGIMNLAANSHHAITLGQIKAFCVLANAAAAGLEAASLLDQLRAAEQRYRRLAENAPDIIFRYELQPQARMAYVNPAIAAVTGYLPDEHYRDPGLILKMVHPEDRPEMESALQGDAVSTRRPIRLTHRNGASVWIEQRSIT